MALYQGPITTYGFFLYPPSSPMNYKSALYIRGTFGLAFLNFVPDGGQLGTNKKRPGENVFDIYYWMSSWMHFVDLLRNEKPIYFFYNDSSGITSLQTSDEPIGEQEGH